MLNMIASQANDFFQLITNKFVIMLGFVGGTVLTAIGYPKQVLFFILWLIVADTITKHYSIVVINYKEFTLGNYRRAWKDKNLSSRGLKNGWGIKGLFYFPILFFAHQASILPEIIWGEIISNTIYSMLSIIEMRSIFENFEDAGYKRYSSVFKFISLKEDEMSKGVSFTTTLNERNDEDDITGTI
jgi:hypothetical protein